MAIVVTNATNAASTAGPSTTIPSATAGNFLVAFVSQNAVTTAPTLADNIGGSWTRQSTSSPFNTNAGALWCFTKVAVGGEVTLTATISTGGAIEGVSCVELNGASTSTTFDTIVATTNLATSSSPTSAAFTTTNGNDVIICAVGEPGAGASGVLSAWTGTPTLNNATTISSRNYVGTFVASGTTYTSSTVTAHEASSHTVGMIVVAIAPGVTGPQVTVIDSLTTTESINTPSVSYGVDVEPGANYTINGVKIV